MRRLRAARMRAVERGACAPRAGPHAALRSDPYMYGSAPGTCAGGPKLYTRARRRLEREAMSRWASSMTAGTLRSRGGTSPICWEKL